MDTFNSLTTTEQNIVYCALEILGNDIDGAWSMLQDQGIYMDCDELIEVVEHFHLA